MQNHRDRTGSTDASLRTQLLSAIEAAEQASRALGPAFQQMKESLRATITRSFGPGSYELAELDVAVKETLPPLAETQANMDEMGKNEATHRARQARVLRELR
jgi:hypothetical protein